MSVKNKIFSHVWCETKKAVHDFTSPKANNNKNNNNNVSENS